MLFILPSQRVLAVCTKILLELQRTSLQTANGQRCIYTTLSDEELDALCTLQKKLTSPPVLAVPQSQGNYTVDTDTCDRQVGGVLLQKQLDGHDKRIGYWSGPLTDDVRMILRPKSVSPLLGRTTSPPIRWRHLFHYTDWTKHAKIDTISCRCYWEPRINVPLVVWNVVQQFSSRWN